MLAYAISLISPLIDAIILPAMPPLVRVCHFLLITYFWLHYFLSSLPKDRAT